MDRISGLEFLDSCVDRGITFFSGTPCSYLGDFLNQLTVDSRIRFVSAVNEGDAVAISAGAELAGKRAGVIFQNSGLGNAVNPLTSLIHTFGIPLLMLISHRGRPRGKADEPQHRLMGEITERLLELLDIGVAALDKRTLDRIFDNALKHLDELRRSFAMIAPHGTFIEAAAAAPVALQSVAGDGDRTIETGLSGDGMSRTAALSIIRESLGRKTAFIATTGKTGRELYAIEDSDNQFYMVGSMGCALPLGIGVASVALERRVCVIDGDGALLMRTGSMATAGALAQSNLVHLVLDNGCHDSTGGQPSYSHAVDFPAMALACGFRWVADVDNCDDLARVLTLSERHDGPIFIRVSIEAGSPSNLGRPAVSPEDVAARFREFLAA